MFARKRTQNCQSSEVWISTMSRVNTVAVNKSARIKDVWNDGSDVGNNELITVFDQFRPSDMKKVTDTNT